MSAISLVGFSLIDIALGLAKKVFMTQAIERQNSLSKSIILVVSLGASLFLLWIIYFREAAYPKSALPFWVQSLPFMNAFMNALSAYFLIRGLQFIRQKKITEHRRQMALAFIASTVFLVGYVVYYGAAGNTPFRGEGLVRPLYYTLLITHVVASIVALPLVLTTFYWSLTQQIERHRRLAKITYPLWLYVGITGVLVFLWLRIIDPMTASVTAL
jgi:putative membrane protein